MRKLNCYVIDDEQHARDLLAHYIEKDERLQFVGSVNNALNFDPSKEAIDLLFLDIQMPGMSGIEFLEKHRPNFKTILTTAFRQYALHGYELGVTDYLLKPILYSRFDKAIHQVLNEIEINRKAIAYDRLESEKDTFILKSGSKHLHLTPEDIYYIEAKGEYIAINTVNNRFIVYMRMKDVEENNHFNNLLRIHRSFFINPKHIQERTTDYILINELQLPVSRSYRSQLRAFFSE